jgi:16S rRNA (adenine1518-N6/adenine1519-N6)-dimethyltransferase
MKKEGHFSPLSEQQLKKVLDFDPVEKLGQNFLIDPEAVMRVVASTIHGASVVEIGSGPGNITKGIAQRASEVTGIEISPDFTEPQQIILRDCPNVEIVNQNALKFNFKKWIDKDREGQHQIIGNIPFHISEPLLTILAGLSDRLDNITLLVGDNLAATMTTTNPFNDRYTRLSFISSIFDVSRVAHIPRNCFWPVPRTDSDIVSLMPKEYPEDGRMLAFQLKRKIVLSQAEGLTLIKVLNGFSTGSEVGKILGKDLSHRRERRQVSYELKRAVYELNDMPVERRNFEGGSRAGKIGTLAGRIGLSAEILSKPFGRLNNEEVRQLAMAIDSL